MKSIWVLTLFPEYFKAFRECGVLSRALQRPGALQVVQLRDFALDAYGAVDDYPYGGGPGMVMRADVLQRALWGVVERAQLAGPEDLRVILPGPRGRPWNAQQAQSFWERDERPILFICGRYEGVDQRFIDRYVDQEISIGDYVLTGGELAVQVILDSALRFCPGVLGNRESPRDESFGQGLLEYPHYTRPQDFEGLKVPEVLLSGHHAKIERQRRTWAQEETLQRRPDL